MTYTRRFVFSLVFARLEGRTYRPVWFELQSWPTSEEGPSNRSADGRSIVS